MRIAGRLELITGPMFSGKSGELIRRLQAAAASGAMVAAFKPALDTRYDAKHLSSHDGLRFPCSTVRTAKEIEASVGSATVVGIDEAQFLDPALSVHCRRLVRSRRRVVVAGLDRDFRGLPFEVVASLLGNADEVERRTAICAVCGEPATRTHRVSAQGERLLVGAQEAYEARCKACFPHRDERGEPAL